MKLNSSLKFGCLHDDATCRCNKLFFSLPPSSTEDRRYEQSGPANIRAGNSICKLFNFHRLFISWLTTRYYGALNYYTQQGHVYAYISRLSGLMMHHPFSANGRDLAHILNGKRFSVRWCAKDHIFFQKLSAKRNYCFRRNQNINSSKNIKKSLEN